MSAALGKEPTPALAAALIEEMDQRLKSLGAESLREVALMKLEGYTNAEIAAHRDCKERTIERKLHLIRKLWS